MPCAVELPCAAGLLGAAEVPDEDSDDELAAGVDDDPASEDDFEDRESVR